MPEHDDDRTGQQTTAQGAGPTGRTAGTSGAGRAWLGRLVPAATFVVGVAIGALVVGAGQTDGGAGAGDDPDETASPSASDTSSPSATAGDTVVTVPAACRQAADNLDRATTVLRRSIGSVRDFDPDAVVDALRRLERIDEQTRPLLAECRQVDVTTAPTTATTATATPTPTATP